MLRQEAGFISRVTLAPCLFLEPCYESLRSFGSVVGAISAGSKALRDCFDLKIESDPCPGSQLCNLGDWKEKINTRKL